MKNASNPGAGLGIQNCECKITFKSSYGKFVGADLKHFRGIKGLSQKKCGCSCPTLTRPLKSLLCVSCELHSRWPKEWQKESEIISVGILSKPKKVGLTLKAFYWIITYILVQTIEVLTGFIALKLPLLYISLTLAELDWYFRHIRPPSLNLRYCFDGRNSSLE